MFILRSKDRGGADHGWLKTQHTFSFADYYNQERMGFRTLRVINEDQIAGGTGFSAHPHRDMEIITYIIKGALTHEDSMGNKATIVPGEVQRMSAGTGVVHSEQNAVHDEVTHLVQIWIKPKARGGMPSYAQKSFEGDLNNKKLVLVVSEDGRDDSLTINQDADIYVSKLKKDEAIEFDVREGRGVWIQTIKGSLAINNEEVFAGDGVAVESKEALRIKSLEESEFILFDLG